MLAARQQEPERLADAYRDIGVVGADDRRRATGKRPCNVIRGPRVKAQAGVVCGASPGERHPRGAAGGRLGPSVGRALGQACWGVDVGQAGCVREGDWHGVSHPPTAIAKTTFCAMWPSLCWRWTGRVRAICGAKYEGCARSNVVCWRSGGARGLCPARSRRGPDSPCRGHPGLGR
jgi:hypothetical protein